MTQTILFAVGPYISHVNCSLKIARDLRHNGFRVVYISFSEIGEHVREQGFDFFPVFDELSFTANPPHKIDLSNIKSWNSLVNKPPSLCFLRSLLEEKIPQGIDPLTSAGKTQILEVLNNLKNDLHFIPNLKTVGSEQHSKLIEPYINHGLKTNLFVNHVHDGIKLNMPLTVAQKEELYWLNLDLLMTISPKYFIRKALPNRLKWNPIQRFFLSIKFYFNVLGYIRKFSSLAKQRMLDKAYFDQLFDQINPACVIFEPFTIQYGIILSKKQIPLILLNEKAYLAYDPNIPPLQSRIIPNSSWINALQIKTSWILHIIKTRFQSWLWSDPIGPGSPFLKKLSRTYGFLKSNISTSMSFGVGLKNIPELILLPESFDFRPKTPFKKPVFYIGGNVNLDRQDKPFDWTKIDRSKPLVYCAFGSIGFEEDRCTKFFKKLIKIFRDLSNYELILAVGPKLETTGFSDVPPNAHLYKSVPQLEILSQASVMITHAGMNSIRECIAFTVPMLCYPLANDQPGNAARVVSRNLGLRGLIRKDSMKAIRTKIQALIQNPIYQNKLKQLNKESNELEKSGAAVERILSIMAENTRSTQGSFQSSSTVDDPL